MVGSGLAGVSSSHRNAIERQIKEQERVEQKKAQDASRRERIRRGVYHDGRLDVVAGNGVMSELGIGDELMSEDDMNGTPEDVAERLRDDAIWEKEEEATKESEKDKERKQRSIQDAQAVGALPIVIIKNYASKVGSNREELLSVLATWAASLAENKVSWFAFLGVLDT